MNEPTVVVAIISGASAIVVAWLNNRPKRTKKRRGKPVRPRRESTKRRHGRGRKPEPAGTASSSAEFGLKRREESN